jgi:colanic acid/amylovoran biosynthesis glycosyltransferase
VPVRTGKAICVATPAFGATTETFITNHIRHLPFRMCILFGGSLQYDQHGASIVSSVSLRLVDPVLRRLGLTNGSPSLFRGQTRFLRREKVAAVLAEYGPAGVQVLPACRGVGVPLIVHFHGYDAYMQDTLDRYGVQYLELFRYAAAVVAVSKDMVSQLMTLGAPRDKIAYIPYGVDTASFDKAAPAQAPPWFLAVGRFVEKKGPFVTLCAFAKVLLRCPEAKLTMIGDGPLLGPCKHLARALGIFTAVQFTGAQPHEVVCDAMRKARAFVQHSLRATDGDSEGTPVAVMEAQAAGLPVVATRHAGIKDVVLNGQSGLLVDELDAVGMADAMITLALDGDLAARMGQVGRQRVLAEFSLSLSIQRLASVIDRLTGGISNSTEIAS